MQSGQYKPVLPPLLPSRCEACGDMSGPCMAPEDNQAVAYLGPNCVFRQVWILSVVLIFLQESVQDLLFLFFLLLTYPCINFLMQAVPCRIRSIINRITPDMGTFMMRTLAPTGYHCYLVRVCKTQAITYMDGEDWKRFLRDYGLQMGDEVSLKVTGITVLATAAKRDLASNFFCTHHIL